MIKTGLHDHRRHRGLVLPEIGQEFWFGGIEGGTVVVVPVPPSPARLTAHEELVRQLSRTTGLPVGVAARVVDDVLAYFDETVEAFVRRRHRELQRRGWTNDRIFEQVAAELAEHRVRPGELSQRQLRRLVYG